MRVLLLCDGGGPLGVGHVIRSLALAEAAVEAGHDVAVAGHFEGSFVEGQLSAAPVEVVPRAALEPDADPQPLVDLVRRLRPDVLHVDSYTAPVRLGEAVSCTVTSNTVPSNTGPSNTGPSNMVLSNMEDGSFGRRAAAVVVDPTFGAELSPRPDDGSTWLLRGSRYTPIRRRVMDARLRDSDDAGNEGDTVVDPAADVDTVARSVLVVMGGTDPVGLAPAVVELLARTGLTLDVMVIAIGGNAERVRAAARGSALSLKILAPVDNLAAIMSRQDLVVSAAGTSVWELCCIGVATALVWAVDNQRDGYDRVVAAGAALGLGGPELAGDAQGGDAQGGDAQGGDAQGGDAQGGDAQGGDEGAVGLLRTALTDSRVRENLILAGRHIVDGLGAWRVVRTWEQAGRQSRLQTQRLGPVAAVPGYGLVARRASLEDSRQLWEWRNDPATRAGSRSSAEVPLDDHLRWLTASLGRTDRLLLVVEDEVGPVGTVRWDLEREWERVEQEWEVSIAVAPDRRGQSLARPVLRAAELALSEVARSSGTGVTAYLAVVHVDNRASMRLFEASDYVPDLPPDPGGFMRFRKAAPVA